MDHRFLKSALDAINYTTSKSVIEYINRVKKIDLIIKNLPYNVLPK